jgi:hypothetical protein
MKYFNECISVEEVKYLYRKLCMKYHPDRPDGDLLLMQSINVEYQDVLKTMNGQQTTGSDGQTFTYRYRNDIESSVIEMLDILLSLKMQDVDIHLIGTWLWLQGNTKAFKEDLKTLGCRWHRLRKCWFWHSPEHRSYQSKDNLTALAEKYGVKMFNHQPTDKAITH